MSTFVFNMKVQSILMFVLHRVSHTLFNTARKVFRPEINVDKKTEPFRNLCSFDVLKDFNKCFKHLLYVNIFYPSLNGWLHLMGLSYEVLNGCNALCGEDSEDMCESCSSWVEYAATRGTL